MEKHARTHFDVESIDYHWSTQDNITIDKLPYIGMSYSGSKGIYVATGFMKWGVTLGTVAAMILSDLILGSPNPWSSLFDPSRPQPLIKSAKSFIEQGLDVAKEFLTGRISASKSINDAMLRKRDGKILKIDNKKIAAYKYVEDIMHTISPVCTHMGCLVS